MVSSVIIEALAAEGYRVVNQELEPRRTGLTYLDNVVYVRREQQCREQPQPTLADLDVNRLLINGTLAPEPPVGEPWWHTVLVVFAAIIISVAIGALGYGFTR